MALEYAADPLKADKEVVLTAVTENGYALSYAADALKASKEVVMAAVTEDGNALQYASTQLREDKEVVKAAVTKEGSALKFALGGLNQDPEYLKFAGLFDDDENKQYERPEKATLSIKFSLAEESTTYATDFAKAMKKDKFLGKFKTYNPNAWSKDSCDPNFTDITYGCWGSSSTCGKQQSENLDQKTQRPSSNSCWRFAFRFHQEESKDTGGFMIQVEERNGLGDGQKIETEMARKVGLKVFRTYTTPDHTFLLKSSMETIGKAVEEWYLGGCANHDLENIFIGYESHNATRPKYEKL